MGRDPGPLPTLEYLVTEYNEYLRSTRVTESLRSQAAVAAAEQRAARDAGKWKDISVAEWNRRALAAAGIDPARWDPSQGFEANRENGQKVYAMYGSWYLGHPELKWAGMAKLAGASVYGGLLEMQDRQGSAKPAIVGGGTLMVIAPWWGLFNVLTGAVAGDAVHDERLETVEKILLDMQKDIFMDLGWQHQAYVEGGLPALKAAYDRGDLSSATYEAWTHIASGNEEAVWEGTTALVYREQAQILAPGYEEIRDLFGGGAITAQISNNAPSPIPGGAPFESLYHSGDLADFEDRWRWIEEHMLPEYRALGDERTRELVSQPLEQLARREFAAAPGPSRQAPGP